MDIMFIDGMPALISVAGDTKYLQVTWLKSRNYRDGMPVVLKSTFPCLLAKDSKSRDSRRTGRGPSRRRNQYYLQDAISSPSLLSNTWEP